MFNNYVYIYIYATLSEFNKINFICILHYIHQKFIKIAK